MPVFEPKLLLREFKEQKSVMIDTLIGEELVRVIYENPLGLEFGSYEIGQVLVDQKEALFTKTKFGVRLNKRIKGEEVRIILKAKKNESESRLF